MCNCLDPVSAPIAFSSTLVEGTTMNSRQQRTVVAVVVTIAVFLVALGVWQRRPAAPTLASFHVINLERSKDRLTRIQTSAEAANIPLVRWPAVDGASIQEDDCARLGISKSIYRYSRDKGQPGLVGCFLSHRTLLESLRDTPAASDAAHVVFEDDATIPADFWDQWRALPIPADWDIVQLGVTFPNLRPVAGHDRIYRHIGDRGNVGGFAYVVRHGALPKICEHAAYMYDPLDVMVRNKHKEWNIYIVWPEVCPHAVGETAVSTITGV
jgi:GR25 family glycosyltransferase involved in LPS biosynthesis